MKTRVWDKFIHPITGYFRKKRGLLIRQLFPDIRDYKICDLGESIHFWEKLGIDIDPRNITIYNISLSETDSFKKRHSEGFNIVIYDGKTIPDQNNMYDLLVCNSVIEHVPIKQRNALIIEMQRVSKRIILQTPAYEFFIEPHFIFPFIHWLPKKLGRLFVEISPWRILSHPDKNTIQNYFWCTSLLKHREVINLLPDCDIHREKFIGLTKSYIVICNKDN